MVTDSNIPMPIAALAFLAALGGTIIAAAITVVLFAIKRRRAAMRTVLAWVVSAALYAVALFAFSFTSHDQRLALGQEKHFCEIDCHIANSVASASRIDALHVVVTVRTRFDETTIGPRRGDAPLTPNPHAVILYDSSGKHLGQPIPANSEGEHEPSTALRPGEQYVTRYSFETTAPLTSARLFIGNASFPERVLIGNEASLAHKKIYFEVSDATRSTQEGDRSAALSTGRG